MNYSTAKLSNKKDWHAIRIAEEKLRFNGYHIKSSCIRNNNIAIPSFTAEKNNKKLVVQTLQGKKLWEFITGSEIDFTVLILALAKASVETPKLSDASLAVSTGGFLETIDYKSVTLPAFENFKHELIPWFFLYVRHFVDRLEH